MSLLLLAVGLSRVVLTQTMCLLLLNSFFEDAHGLSEGSRFLGVEDVGEIRVDGGAVSLKKFGLDRARIKATHDGLEVLVEGHDGTTLDGMMEFGEGALGCTLVLESVEEGVANVIPGRLQNSLIVAIGVVVVPPAEGFTSQGGGEGKASLQAVV